MVEEVPDDDHVILFWNQVFCLCFFFLFFCNKLTKNGSFEGKYLPWALCAFDLLLGGKKKQVLFF